MRTVVFVLGAGASAESGVPVVSNFIESAEAIYRADHADYTESYRRVLDFIHAIIPLKLHSDLDEFNLEHIFTFLEFCYRLNHLDWFVSARDARKLRQDLVHVILDTIQKTSQFQIRHGNSMPLSPHKSYDAFVAAVTELRRKRDRVVVVTFNYDICLEMAFVASGIPFHYGLGDEKIGADRESVPVLKMHGSISWMKDSSAEPRIRHLDLERFLSNSGFADRCLSDHYSGPVYLNIGQAMRLTYPELDDDDAQNEYPLLIAPVYDKMREYEVFAPIWIRAVEYVSQASEIYLCGYSMPATDILFKHILSIAGWKNKAFKHVIIVDPADRVAERYYSLLERGIDKRFIHRQTCFSSLALAPRFR